MPEKRYRCWENSLEFCHGEGRETVPVSFTTNSKSKPQHLYLIPYSLDTQKRHHHETQRGKVVWFMVQLEVLVQGEWKAVIRYDCAHGYAHRDRFNLRGNRLKEDLGMDYEEALTFADDDLDDCWEIYRGRFLEGEYP